MNILQAGAIALFVYGLFLNLLNISRKEEIPQWVALAYSLTIFALLMLGNIR